MSPLPKAIGLKSRGLRDKGIAVLLLAAMQMPLATAARAGAIDAALAHPGRPEADLFQKT